MNKCLLAILLLSQVATTQAQWLVAGRGDNGLTVTVMAGSGKIVTNDGGQPVVTALFQADFKGSIKTQLRAVSLRECGAGFGKLIYLDTDGKVTDTQAFAIGGGSIVDNVASVLCVAAEQIRAGQSAPRAE